MKLSKFTFAGVVVCVLSVVCAAQVLARTESDKASGADAANISAPEAGAAGGTNTTANELNALGLFWAGLRDWFRGLFRRRPA